MDMRIYYRKIQEKEAELQEDPVVIVSVETPDGGKAGVLTEVSRRNAAKLVVDGYAQIASAEAAHEFKEAVKMAKAEAEEKAAARRMEFTFVAPGEMRKATIRPVKA